MDYVDHDLLIARICFGYHFCKTSSGTFLYGSASAENKYLAEEIYQQTLDDANFDHLYTDDELRALLIEQGAWSLEKEDILKLVEEDINKWKMALYDMLFRSNEVERIRKRLAVAKSEYSKLLHEKHRWDNLTKEGLADYARTRFLTGCSIFRMDKTPIWPNPLVNFRESDSLLDKIYEIVAVARIPEEKFRDLALSEEWAKIWSMRNVVKLFDRVATDLTDDQVSLVRWASLYELIKNHPECPHETVVSDHDMLDGWLLIQRKKSEAARAKSIAEGKITNEKIKNSEEVYLMADTMEDAKKIFDMNDSYSESIRKARFNYLNKKGEVKEQDMPDTKQKLRMEIAQAAIKQRKGM